MEEKKKSRKTKEIKTENLKEKANKFYDENRNRNRQEPPKEEPKPEPAAKTSIVQQIIDHLFGRKYYAVVSYRIGTFMIGLHEPIFTSRRDAEEYLNDVMVFRKLEIVSFRSRSNYATSVDESGCWHTTIPNE